MALAFTLALTACGGSNGGGSGSSTSAPPPPEQVRVSSTLPAQINRHVQNGGTVTIRITGDNGDIFERNVTIDANGRFNANFEVPAGGTYEITIEVRDRTGSLIASARQDANTNEPTEVNVTNPIIAIPQSGQMTLIWDNLVDAPTILIRWDPPRQVTPRSQIQIARQQAGTRTRYTLTNLTDNEFYTFTVQARNRQAINDLATYRVGNTVGPNNDNDEWIDRIDPDDDNDGTPDLSDNCPLIYNPSQRNSDRTATYNDDRGDACDTDDDNDGILDTDDNCPIHANADQANDITPNDPAGDACDDQDNDGLVDAEDPCPPIPVSNCRAINNLADLNAISDDGSSYYLTTDLINTDRPSIQIRGFEAIFHGGGHTISGLTRPLFHTINSTATVTNLGIIGSTLAYTNHGTINASYATGDSSTSVTGTSHSGGLVDQNTGLITISYATGNIVCDTAGTCRIGGVVGTNSGGTITNSYATGNITCLAIANGRICTPGGLVGYLFGTITNSYATGAITCPPTRLACQYDGGGLVGARNNTTNDASKIETSYRVASAAGDTSDRRGLHRTLAQLRCPTAAGQTCQGATTPTYHNWDSTIWDFGTDQDLPTLRTVYVYRDSDGDGINDNNDNCPRVANPDQNNTDGAADGGDACDDDDDNDDRPDTADNCPYIPNPNQANTYDSNDNEGDACDDTDGDTHLDINDAFPTDPTEHLDSDGDRIGDNADSCPTDANTSCQSIATDQDLIDLLYGTSGNDGYYRLTANINISADTTWLPIANFRGTLNGDNHTITFHATQPNPPLFGDINASAIITNIGILNSTLARANHGNISYAYATGNSYSYTSSSLSFPIQYLYSHNFSGGLVGINAGTIAHSYATGDNACTGSTCSSGGLVGINWGFSSTITHSHATGSNNGTYSGGLVGWHTGGTITNSYATGSSDGSSSPGIAGGLVGLNDGAITNSYATGSSSGVESGGLVGRSRAPFGTITNSYATGSSASTIYSGGLVGLNEGNITNSYATGGSSSFGRDSFSGGLVGFNDRGTITNSYATGISSSSSLGDSHNGGLVGRNVAGTITNAYRVQASGVTNTLGTAITLRNLRTATSLSGWLSPPWNFGTTSQLPRHDSSTGIPFCPGATSYSVTSCRW